MKPSITRITLMLCCCLIFGASGCQKSLAVTDEVAPMAVPSDPEAKDEAGRTPLIRAALAGSSEEVARLIKAGADVDGRGDIPRVAEHATPLIAAAYAWKPEIVRQLLAAGADVNALSRSGSALNKALDASLYFLTLGGNPSLTEPSVLPIVQELIKAGADVNATDRKKVTPLMIAASCGLSQTVEALLAAGADVNAKDVENYTALMTAAEVGVSGYEKVLERLIAAGADVKVKNTRGSTALVLSMASAPGRDPGKAVPILLAAGADPTDGFESWQMLHLASQAGSLEAVKALLKAGADAKAKDARNDTTLMHAASSDSSDEVSTEIAKLLLDAGAEINAKDDDGDTALFIAAALEKKALAKLLLDRGADPQVKNKKGESAEEFLKKGSPGTYAPSSPKPQLPSKEMEAFWYAAYSGNVTAIRELAAKGVRVDQATEKGYTPYRLALERHQLEAIRALVGLSGDVNAIIKDTGSTYLIDAALTGDLDVIDLLISLKADVNLASSEGIMPILTAVGEHHFKAAKRLLEAGAKVNVRTDHGYWLLLAAVHASTSRTAIGLRADAEGVELIQAMLAAGANVNVQDLSGMTPLMLAADRSAGELVSIFLKAGADVRLKNNKGQTALDLATSAEIKALLRGAEEK